MALTLRATCGCAKMHSCIFVASSTPIYQVLCRLVLKKGSNAEEKYLYL